jgi:formiminotetrahydrofolate cyclodeaminase
MLSELRVADLLAALGERTPAPASGSAAALTGALAAALAELAARYAGDEDAAARAQELVRRLAKLADEDAAAYTAFMADRNDATRRRIFEIPEEVAALADEAGELAERQRTRLHESVGADAEAAVELAAAAARVARRLAQINALPR